MPAPKRITISDIAEKSGVSISAVSFALNGRKGVSDETRARVLNVAEDLGWAPTRAAKALAGASTDTFGMVLARDPHHLGVESFFMRFLAGIESELTQRGYGLLLQVVPSVEQELATLRKWRNSRQVDGVLLVDLTLDDPRVALALEPNALPTVVVGEPTVARGLTSVSADDAASMREAVRYLAGLGHRRIAHISGLPHLAHTHIRDAAFGAETTRRGLERMVFRTDYTMSEGARATAEAMQAERAPTAFIYDNDVMAVAGLTVLGEHGLRVPEDISVIAWDDSVLCEHTRPALTTLSRDIVGFGAHAARSLFDLVEGAEHQAFYDVQPQLNVRGSTGTAPTRIPG